MPWLDAWRAKWGILAERKMKIASAIGTEFHRCVESWLDNGAYKSGPATIDGFNMPSTIPRIEGMMQSFIKWAMTVEGTIEHTEMQVVSKVHTYSGTLDAFGTFGKKVVIYDWKTSSRIYDSMQIQLAAYANAYNEQYGTKIKDGVIVHVSKDKPHFKVTVKEFKLGKRPFNEFLKLRAMFDEIHTGAK